MTCWSPDCSFPPLLLVFLLETLNAKKATGMRRSPKKKAGSFIPEITGAGGLIFSLVAQREHLVKKTNRFPK